MTHRQRVVAAVERHLASRRPAQVPDSGTSERTPAGFYPVSELRRHVVMAGLELRCLACGAEGSTGVLPRDAGYSAAVEAFLAAHRPCA